MKSPKPPKVVPRSLLILRRRVLAEMRKPGQDRRPRFESDAELAHFLGVEPSHMSHFLRSQKPQNIRGVSWAVVDKLAEAFNLHIWELFYTDVPVDDWRVK